jgi:uncharacterized protein (TIGR02996 family)
MRTFHYRDAKSDKFWNIELHGSSFTAHFGRQGTKGQTQTKEFADEAKAQKEYDKLVKEKLAKGYVETTPASAHSPAPAGHLPSLRAALEEALTATPDDLGAHMAYADHLQEQGDPRGEFIQVQLALEDAGIPAAERRRLQKREREVLDVHAAEWLGSLAPVLLPAEDKVKAWLMDRPPNHVFARGWLDTLRLPLLTFEVGRAFRGAPNLQLLRTLVIEAHDWDDPGFDELTAANYFGNLHKLQVGPQGRMCHMEAEGVLPLLEKAPRLEELLLYAHNVPVGDVFALPLPHLRVLHVWHLHGYPLEVLAANASLGRLTHLSLWPHALEPAGNQAAHITFDGVRALVHSPNLPSLTHLELFLTDLGDRGCEEIVNSVILKRLKVLDVSHGRITDAGAQTLAACPDLTHLERLGIASNYLTSAGIAALRATGVAVKSDQQHTGWEMNPWDYLGEGDWE